jgi:hypothetical protein
MFELAGTVGNQTKIKDLKTQEGVKDTYLDHFLDKIAGSYKKKQGVVAKRTALEAQYARLPPNVFSPVWRIKGVQSRSPNTQKYQLIP